MIQKRSEPARRPKRIWVRLALAALAILVVAAAGRQLAGLVPGFAGWVRGLGPLGPVAFIVGYAVATVAFVPGSFLTLAAGAVFGMGAGTVYVMIGATLGAAAAFTFSRHLARGPFERRLLTDPRFIAIDQAIAREGRKVAFLLRVSPLFPFTLLIRPWPHPNPVRGLPARVCWHAAGNLALRILRKGGRRPRRCRCWSGDGTGARRLPRARRRVGRHAVRRPSGRPPCPPGAH